MLGNYLQQTTSADTFLDALFSWRFKGLELNHLLKLAADKKNSYLLILKLISHVNRLLANDSNAI